MEIKAADVMKLLLLRSGCGLLVGSFDSGDNLLDSLLLGIHGPWS